MILLSDVLWLIVCFFSSYFQINPDIIDNYGALNLCLEADLPLFIDPFLLFASDKPEYRKLHEDIVNHLLSLKKTALNDADASNKIFQFPEIKQNWLGLSKYGNNGKGLGLKFAKNLRKAFNGFYRSFGDETISTATHIEKLTLVGSGIGRDFISDFSTNLIFEFLLNYTEQFAINHLEDYQVKEFNIRCVYNEDYTIKTPKKFKLPFFYRNGDDKDFILLTP